MYMTVWVCTRPFLIQLFLLLCHRSSRRYLWAVKNNVSSIQWPCTTNYTRTTYGQTRSSTFLVIQCPGREFMECQVVSSICSFVCVVISVFIFKYVSGCIVSPSSLIELSIWSSFEVSDVVDYLTSTFRGNLVDVRTWKEIVPKHT